MTAPALQAHHAARDAAKEDIRQRLDFPGAARAHLKNVARAGNGLRATCPFHKGAKNRSFAVYEHGFLCFQCGATGDVFDFFAKVEGKSFVTVLRELAQLTGVTLTRDQNGAGEQGVSMHALLTWWRQLVADATTEAAGRTPPLALAVVVGQLGYLTAPTEAWQRADALTQKELARRGLDALTTLTEGWWFLDLDGEDRVGGMLPLHDDGTPRGPLVTLDATGPVGLGWQVAKDKVRDTGTVLLTPTLHDWWAWRADARALHLPLVYLVNPGHIPFGTEAQFANLASRDPAVLDVYLVHNPTNPAQTDANIHAAGKAALSAGIRPLAVGWMPTPSDHPDEAWAVLIALGSDVMELWVTLLQKSLSDRPPRERLVRTTAKLGPILGPLLVSTLPAQVALAEAYVLWIGRALRLARANLIQGLTAAARG